ncbi:PLD nuclease N-terminal domain-containing protein [Pseudactinotalea terrae]|uniref:PLD nuclease N-terminal domain-containing protein n=1 Tax=Pseudactinotalea terrae TaxID=1743262 RepID=UPI0012E184E8|nr:PLD nuclease N-terminal domain-containing protein [Pseudactinotalea terrae]
MRQVFALLILAAVIYGIVDCAQADARTRRNIPLWIWVALMIVLPLVGTVIWLIVSRLILPGPEVAQRRPVAPDDDPEFLRELERRTKRPQPEADPTPSSDENPASGDAVEDEPGPNESR